MHCGGTGDGRGFFLVLYQLSSILLFRTNSVLRYMSMTCELLLPSVNKHHSLYATLHQPTEKVVDVFEQSLNHFCRVHSRF